MAKDLILNGKVVGIMHHETAPMQSITICGETYEFHSYEEVQPLLQNETYRLGTRYARYMRCKAMNAPSFILDTQKQYLDETTAVVNELYRIHKEMADYQREYF